MRRLLLLALLLLPALTTGAAGQGQSMSRETYQLLTRARDLLGEERYDQARQLLAEAELQGDCCDPELAVVLQTRAYVEIAAGNERSALSYLKEALDLDALPAEVAHRLRFTLAQLYARQEQYPEAAATLETWLRAEPQPDADAHQLAAQVYARLGRFDPAIRHARAALAADPSHREGRHRLLLGLLLQAKRWKEAVQLLEKEILLRFPNRLEYWRQLAALRLQLGREERAAAALELAHRRGLLEARDLERLAQLYLRLKAPLKAARLLQQALDSGQLRRTTANHRLLADAWQLAREPEQTLQALARAGEGRDLLRAGELLLGLERWREAAQRLRAALERGDLKRRGRAQLLLGMALMRQEDSDGARSAFRAAASGSGDSDKIRGQAERWLAYLDSRG